MRVLASLTCLLFILLMHASPVHPRSIDPLPSSMAPIEVVTDSSSGGYIFVDLSTGAWNDPTTYVLILDGRTGEVVWYRQFASNISLQNGHICYRRAPYFLLLDHQYEVMDSVTSVYWPNDGHEFLWAENGHYWLIGKEHQPVDMSDIVPGGDPDAVISWKLIQELDEDKNIVAEWRMRHHYDILDAVGIDLTGDWLDVNHTNSIDLLPDGDIVISNRTMSECTRIDWETGEIVWRFGGPNAVHQDFEFVGDDTRGFDWQHDIRYNEATDTWTIYDNGDFLDPRYSSAVEFILDEDNMTAEVVNRYVNEDSAYFFAAGSARKQPNGNMLVGWGGRNEPGHPFFTEYSEDGAVVMQATVDSQELFGHYRAIRYHDWSPTQSDRPYLIADVDSDAETVTLTYPVFGPREWEEYRVYNNGVLAATTSQHQVVFDGLPEGIHTFTVRAMDDGEISDLSNAATVEVSWTGVGEEAVLRDHALLTTYPNPFNGMATLAFDLDRPARVPLAVYDILGRQVLAGELNGVAGMNRHLLDLSNQPSGTFLLHVNGQTRRLVLVK